MTRRVLIALLFLYRRLASPVLFAFGVRCRFFPSCSCYAEQALRAHGALRGSALAAWRLLRCHPLSPGGLDLVPPVPVSGARAPDRGPLQALGMKARG